MYRHGIKLSNFIHDETISELRIDNNLQDNIRLIEKIMIDGMRSVMPNTRIAVEGALFVRWSKDAKAIYDEQDNMLIWTEDIKAPNPKKKDNPLNYLLEAPIEEVIKQCPTGHRIVWKHGGKQFYGYQPLTSVYN
jgi:hypothetical protein